jgi:hypothetical protein
MHSFICEGWILILEEYLAPGTDDSEGHDTGS